MPRTLSQASAHLSQANVIPSVSSSYLPTVQSLRRFSNHQVACVLLASSLRHTQPAFGFLHDSDPEDLEQSPFIGAQPEPESPVFAYLLSVPASVVQVDILPIPESALLVHVMTVF